MKVRFLQQMVGPASFDQGEIAEVEDGLGARLVEAGIAEAVAASPKDERAVAAEPSRKATRR